MPYPLSPASITCEIEVIPGLEAFARDELQMRFRQHVTIEPSLKEGLIPIIYSGDLSALLDLQSVLAVYGQRWFPIPRPKALLGNAEFAVFASMLDVVRGLHPPHTFRTFRMSAAGEESEVMVRLRDRIAQATGLQFVPEEGDLLIRLRRPLDGTDGWDALVRLSPRPLSTRPWRVCNLAGALNASVAHAMIRLTRPQPDNVVLNLMSGSGTLLIERLIWGPARIAIGCDTSAEALRCAQANVAASGHNDIRLETWDVQATPLPDRMVDVLLADLPFGQLVGSHEINTVLYPQVLAEAGRVALPGATFVAITQDMRLWESTIAAAHAHWTLEDVVPIKLPIASGYLHPRVYVLRREA